MKTQSFGQDLPLHPDPQATQNIPIPPFVETIAVRLSWASSVAESEAYRLLAAPYYHGAVTAENREQLLARFPFMAELNAPAPIADYTIMLVSLWLTIEEMYHRGKLLPDEIMQGLMAKTTTTHLRDCRENENGCTQNIPQPHD
ncbi:MULTISPECIES: hypothetical protein [Kosakonia]|uniref:hypothetical protein n=1 Tax=Kosakonia TaxID=1330547 RepID=UPI0013646E89|nr:MULTISPECIES: hypothetical protein [Kosakonia]MCZ3383542.1 hypothetical protein [Kosakonia sp. SOY2]QHM93509.1 hypothetical protein FGE25_04165 [Kosakonia sacchari]